MTKLIGISRIKNEADFIEHFARHNLNILDEFHIIDDQSIDNTFEILTDLAEEGLPIKCYSLQDKDAQIKNLQSEALTGLMHRLVPLNSGTDAYVLPLDADEIILCKREDLIARLAHMP